MFTREIKYDRLTKDYAMTLNGEFVGYAASYHAAEIELDRLAFELLNSGIFMPADFETETAQAVDSEAA
jgi:hypothetical protein